VEIMKWSIIIFIFVLWVTPVVAYEVPAPISVD
jgi:hypothetical protein